MWSMTGAQRWTTGCSTRFNQGQTNLAVALNSRAKSILRRLKPPCRGWFLPLEVLLKIITGKLGKGELTLSYIRCLSQ